MKRLAAVGSLIVGSIPGFLLSFAIVRLLPLERADLFLLQLSTTVILTSLLAQTYESSLIAEYGRILAADVNPSLQDFRAAQKRGLAFAIPLNIVLFPSILAVYFLSGELRTSYSSLLVIGIPLAVFPTVAAQSSVFSAYLIARRKLNPVFLSVGLRGLPTIAAVLVLQSPFALGISYTSGEIVRWVFLRHIATSRTIGGNRQLSLPSYMGLVQQLSSMGVAHGATVISRSFLAAGPIGSIAFADNADKIYFASNQVVLSGAVLPSVAELPRRLRLLSLNECRATLRAEAAKILAYAAALCVPLEVLMLSIVHFSESSIVARFSQSISWACILVVAVPGLALNMWSSRVILLAKLNRLLLPLSLLMLCSSAAACAVLFTVLGPSGVIVAIVITQSIVGAAYFTVVDRRAAAVLAAPALQSQMSQGEGLK